MTILTWLAAKGDVSAGIIPASPTYPNGAIDGMPVNPVTPAAVNATTLSATGAITATGGVAGNVTGNVSGGYVGSTVVTGLVAGTTHTLVGATPLTAQVNVVATVANASDAVALPLVSSVPLGTEVIVFNNGAHPAAVWPQAADKVDGGTTGVAVTLTNALRCGYIATTANNWISAQLGAVSA